MAGLSTAYELSLRGIDICLLEAADRPGGVINTDRFDGWIVDTGPDSLLAQKPAGVALCRELGLEDRLVTTTPPRTAYVLRGGVLQPLSEGSFLGFPISLASLARAPLFTWRGKVRMACEIVMPRLSTDDDESIASFVRRRFGAEALNYLAEPLLAGIHAGDVERLSMRSLFPRLLEAEQRSGSVLRAVRAQPKPLSHSASGGAFVSLKGGIRELVDALAAALPQGVLRLSERVTELRRAGGFTIESSSGTLRARAVVLSVPAYVAAGLLLGIDTSLAGLCDAVPYASTATVAFGYQRSQIRHPLNGTGFVVPRVERNPLLAATWVTSKWPGRAPEGYALLRAFLGGGRDPHRLERPDDELIATARQALADTLGIDGDPVFARLYRYTRQSPQYEVGHLQRVATIEQRLSHVPGLFLTGSGFRAIGIPDCIADGREMAARAAAFIAAETGQQHEATTRRPQA